MSHSICSKLSYFIAIAIERVFFGNKHGFFLLHFHPTKLDAIHPSVRIHSSSQPTIEPSIHSSLYSVQRYTLDSVYSKLVDAVNVRFDECDDGAAFVKCLFLCCAAHTLTYLRKYERHLYTKQKQQQQVLTAPNEPYNTLSCSSSNSFGSELLRIGRLFYFCYGIHFSSYKFSSGINIQHSIRIQFEIF